MNRVTASIGSIVFFLIAPGFFAGVIPWWFSQWRVKPSVLDTTWLKFVGAALVAVGFLALLDSFARFALQGIGTPAPVLPTRHLVVTGAYRHVRNPIYVAVVALVLGQGLLFAREGLLLYGAILWLGFHLFVIGYEEPTLQTTFGGEYHRYTAKLPRWLPRIRPWTPSS